MSLSAEELERYQRHIILHEIGGAGQQKIKQARILIIGAGGLGTPILHYLAAAGIGKIGIVDDDIVSLSNLQRQLFYQTAHIGKKKVEIAAAHSKAQNPHCEITPHDERLTIENIERLLQNYDMILDGSDNFATRFLVNDACFFLKKTLISAAIAGFSGQLSSFRSWESPQAPSYRCLVPQAPDTTEDCTENGVLGCIAGMMGSLTAWEAIRQICNIEETILNKLLLLDAKSLTMRTVKLNWNKTNPLNGTGTCAKNLLELHPPPPVK